MKVSESFVVPETRDVVWRVVGDVERVARCLPGVERVTMLDMLCTPFIRFIQLYFFRLGFLDGLAGIQMCMLQAFFVSFVKRARLWELQHALPQPREKPPAENDSYNRG